VQYLRPNDRVRLTQPIPTLWLQCGDVGVVRSVWDGTPGFMEVEFQKPGESFAVRALVAAENLDVIERASADSH
jgi:hypothetical protein